MRSLKIPVRNLTHVALGLSAAVILPLVSGTIAYVLFAILFLTFILVRRVSLFSIFHSSDHTSYGEFFFVLGVACTYILYIHEPQAWYAALLVLSVADPLAAIMGRLFGTRTYSITGEVRTVEGSVVCALVSTYILIMVGVAPSVAVPGGIAFALIETVSIRGSDNLILPLLAGLLVHLTL